MKYKDQWDGGGRERCGSVFFRWEVDPEPEVVKDRGIHELLETDHSRLGLSLERVTSASTVFCRRGVS